jgi:hypothetical protein
MNVRTAIFGLRPVLRFVLMGFLVLAARFLLFPGLVLNRLAGLPYQDSFAAGTADEWHALGGTWELADGTMRNESDERGAKLMAGSVHWRDYAVEADIQLLGQDGDAGLLLRSSDEENGVDSYNGYYAGLRNHDHTLVLGRADHGWIENQAVPIPGGIRPFHWYHVKLIAVGCDIAASLTDPLQDIAISAAMSENDCKPTGFAPIPRAGCGGMFGPTRPPSRILKRSGRKPPCQDPLTRQAFRPVRSLRDPQPSLLRLGIHHPPFPSTRPSWHRR